MVGSLRCQIMVSRTRCHSSTLCTTAALRELARPAAGSGGPRATHQPLEARRHEASRVTWHPKHITQSVGHLHSSLAHCVVQQAVLQNRIHGCLLAGEGGGLLHLVCLLGLCKAHLAAGQCWPWLRRHGARRCCSSSLLQPGAHDAFLPLLRLACMLRHPQAVHLSLQAVVPLLQAVHPLSQVGVVCVHGLLHVVQPAAKRAGGEETWVRERAWKPPSSQRAFPNLVHAVICG